MEDIIVWLAAIVACNFLVSIGAQEANNIKPKTETEYDQVLVGQETIKKADEFNQRLLKQIQFKIKTSLEEYKNINDQNEQLSKLIEKQKQNIDKMRDENEKATKEIMEAKHKLAQIKVLIDHSWLVLERCQDIKGQDAAVRRLANRIAHEMAELESTPKAKNYYLSKYLRLLRVLERRVSREAKEHKLPRENRLDAPHSSLESVES